MADIGESFLRDQLLDRRERLRAALAVSKQAEPLVQLLNEVDSALERITAGTYGICEACHESIEKHRLITDPLVRYCLDHLTSDQQRALEQDLDLASQMQKELLPKQNLTFDGWQVVHYYEPSGPVSGDYCDVIVREGAGKSLFFALGDASGKGIAASMLMAQLHAIFRTLIAAELPVQELVGRASRIFCESAMSPYFATLVCGRAGASGGIEVCNAGHCPPLLVRGGELARLEATGLPLGMFCSAEYATQSLALAPGDRLFLYTDGLSEARSRTNEEYGEKRLAGVLARSYSLPLQDVVRTCVKDLADFRSGAPASDDLSIMAIGRVG